jgi:hypothetical protein
MWAAAVYFTLVRLGHISCMSILIPAEDSKPNYGSYKAYLASQRGTLRLTDHNRVLRSQHGAEKRMRSERSCVAMSSLSTRGHQTRLEFTMVAH